MKLTTKRDWRFFWRELFLYLIPMILIVGTVDVFVQFMRCPLHPEWSAPCSIIWLVAAIYGVFLLLAIIFAIISARMLRKVKKQIENEFTESVNDHIQEQTVENKMSEDKTIEKKTKKTQNKKIIAKKEKVSEQKISENKKVSKKVSTKKAVKK